MRALDLFSGIGGFSLGLERAGIKTVAFCEKDIHCQKVLKKHWPEIPIHEDITKLKGEDFYGIDVICGGFPCQSVSVAGKKEGFENKEKSGLWYEYKRIIKEARPRFVIIENVRNLLNIGFAEVLQGLYDIGYDAEWEIISAASIGANHRRERIWIIAYPRGNRGRVQSERPEGKNQILTEYNGENEHASNSDIQGLERPWRPGKAQEVCTQMPISSSIMQSTHSYVSRLWPTFASEKEKSEWWTETTSSFRDWWEAQSEFCGMDDGLSSGLDESERFRKERIKQLGNSIVPFIAQLTGERIINI